MSFTDQKPWTASIGDCNLQWGGRPNGKSFRCKLCGHKFAPGDIVRWIYGGTKTTNFFTCDKCDTGNNAEMIDKMVAFIEESKVRFWWLWDALESWQKEAYRI